MHEKVLWFLKRAPMKIINFKKKNMKLLTKEQQESYENAKLCYICKEIFKDRYVKDKKYCKVRDHCHYTEECRGAAHSICNLKNSVPKKILIVFHNGSNYDYDFIIKKLAEELKKTIYLFRRKQWKIYNLYSSNKKKLQELIKMKKKLQKKYVLYITIYW